MNLLLNAYEYWRYEKKNQQKFEPLSSEHENQLGDSGHHHERMHLRHTHSDEKQKFSWKVFMDSPQYELAVNIVGVFNILCIVVKQIDVAGTTQYILGWMYVQIGINTLFLIELISDFIVHGISKSYSGHFRTWPETLCQILNLVAIVQFCQHSDDVSTYNSIVTNFEMIVFVRTLKLLTLLYEI